jgi:hypothetical protein
MQPASEAGRPLALSELSRRRPGLKRWLHGLTMLPNLRLTRRRGPTLGWKLKLRWKPPARVELRWPKWSTIWHFVRVAWHFVRVAMHLMRVAFHLARVLAWVLWRIARRVVDWVWDNLRAFVLDSYDSLRSQGSRILREEPGIDEARDARSVAVFVQFSTDGTISEMVRRQVVAYRELGFAVALVSNSPAFPEASWQAARQVASLVVWRRNEGLDFGAWKDLTPMVLARWPQAEELMLVNDSVLGPIRSLAPVLDAMRAEGPGVFGLLESQQGGPHLQSWLTLVRGSAAVGDVADFLRRLKLSRSKWKIIQRGELRLARRMQAAGHRVAAIYGYEQLIRIALADPEERAYLERALPAWFALADPSEYHEILMDRPVNPAHHLWRALTGPAGCPFIKTELVRRNPGKLPEVETWPQLVPPDAPCPVPVIREHLALLGP